ncbi:MAG TPA: hypothetical protein VLG36_04510 [Candidatus Chromulinivoraceae bacterium]|nr:hypothetical protein [Candidatus Chromulinivoraceae bacterium]
MSLDELQDEIRDALSAAGLAVSDFILDPRHGGVLVKSDDYHQLEQARETLKTDFVAIWGPSPTDPHLYVRPRSQE